MGLIEVASGNSVWRGIDYYENKKVISWEKTSKTTYIGKVAGSGGKIYDVEVDTAHPKRSKCNCAFANGRRVVCKHMLAVYFTAEPEQVDDFLKQVEAYEEEERLREQQEYEELEKYVKSLSKKELQSVCIAALFELEEYRNNRYW